MLVQDGWIAFNPKETALDDLEEFVQQLERTRKRPTSVKWAVIALHSSLQNFCVASLRRPHLAALNGKSREERIKWDEEFQRRYEEQALNTDDPGVLAVWVNKYQTANPPPVMRLLPFLKLLNSAYPNPAHNDALRILDKRYRDELIHLKPHTWISNINDMAHFMEKCLPVLEHFAASALAAMLLPDEEERGRELVRRARQSLMKLQAGDP